MPLRLCVFLLGAWLILGPGPARAEPIVSGPGLSGLGTYTGTFTYEPASATQALLTIALTNTTPAERGGYLTAFAFNNPDGQVATISPVSLPTNFSLLPAGSNAVNAAPFGRFDFGVSTGGSFEGGGAPSRGLGVGVTGTFRFTLTGTNLAALSAASFFAEVSAPPGDGQGHLPFVARFRGFARGGSDKVPGILDEGTTPAEVPHAPEPGSLLLAAAGAAGLALMARRRRRPDREL